eukprot:5275353-Alexandrium_andersonii.AAC.1
MACAAVAKLAEVWDSYPVEAVWSLAGRRIFDIEAETLAVALGIIGYEQLTAAWLKPVELLPMASQDQA